MCRSRLVLMIIIVMFWGFASSCIESTSLNQGKTESSHTLSSGDNTSSSENSDSNDTDDSDDSSDSEEAGDDSSEDDSDENNDTDDDSGDDEQDSDDTMTYALDDTDQDGYSDAYESLYGTDPNDAASYPGTTVYSDFELEYYDDDTLPNADEFFASDGWEEKWDFVKSTLTSWELPEYYDICITPNRLYDDKDPMCGSEKTELIGDEFGPYGGFSFDGDRYYYTFDESSSEGTYELGNHLLILNPDPSFGCLFIYSINTWTRRSCKDNDANEAMENGEAGYIWAFSIYGIKEGELSENESLEFDADYSRNKLDCSIEEEEECSE